MDLNRKLGEALHKARMLEAYFSAGLKDATGLRTELEGLVSPAPRKGGLSPEDEARILSNRFKAIKKRK